MSATKNVCSCTWVCVCARAREGLGEKKPENVSAARRCRAAAAVIREGEDGPSVSVDSGLGEHTGQLGAACDRQSCFPERAIFPQQRESVYSSVHLQALLDLSERDPS